MLVILSGPSGVGKDTVINAWRAVNPLVERVVAYTTRAPRPGEIAGIDYQFVSRDEFLSRAEEGEFLEYKEVHDYHYATPLRDMELLLAAGKIAILKIDVQGALSVMALRPDAVTVFLLPPDADELARRIRERGTEDQVAMSKRLENARAEIALAHHYGNRIINHSVQQVVMELEAIVQQKQERA